MSYPLLYPPICQWYGRHNISGAAAFTGRQGHPLETAQPDRVWLLHAGSNAGAQLVSVVGGGVAIVLMLLTEQFLQLWTGNADLAHRIAPVLRLLLLGNLLNGLMHIPYQTQLAHGWTSLANRINLISVLLIIPAILWVTSHYGSEGAAFVWVVLNSGYVFVGIHFMYRRILSAEKWRWYWLDVARPLGAAVLAGVLVKSAWSAMGVPANPAALLTVVSIAAFGASFASSGELLGRARRMVARWRS